MGNGSWEKRFRSEIISRIFESSERLAREKSKSPIERKGKVKRDWIQSQIPNKLEDRKTRSEKQREKRRVREWNGIEDIFREPRFP